jgi:hypothetical protein
VCGVIAKGNIGLPSNPMAALENAPALALASMSNAWRFKAVCVVPR